jgi:GntR family transcriptional regulator
MTELRDNMKLDANDSTPLYLQLKSELKTAIAEQIYSCDDRIPTETQLSEQYGVSRITVRQAVQALCEEGYLVKKQGKGTFVCHRRIARKLDNMMSFTQACEANQMIPSTIVLERQVRPLTDAEQAAFGESGDTRYLVIVRLRQADSLPVILEQNYFPLPKYDFLRSEELQDSLFGALERRGVRVHAIRNTTLDVILATTALAQKMGVNRGIPLFNTTTKNYDRNNELVYLGQEYIVCERYRFTLADYVAEETD